MRHELWGLRKIDTKEPVYTYWASSNRHRALFARRDEESLSESQEWGHGAVQNHRL